MKNFDWKKVIPHLIAVGIFVIVALFYCKPALQGKVLQQSDITQWKGMSKDIYDFKEKHGDAPLWTNSMFSGMPGYLIAGKTNNVIPYYFTEALSLFFAKPFQFFILACICFYFLSQVLKTNSWIGIVGALAYAYATYNPIIIGVGHDTKMLSIALIPGFIGGIILIYDRFYWWGFALTALFTSALISQNHYQVTYYAIIIAAFMSVAYAIFWIKNKEWKHLLVAASVTVFAGVTGVLANAVVILPNYEYTQETIRGGSALASDSSNVGKTGLNKEYAFSYSMYKAEPFVLLVPYIFGGSNRMEMEQEKSEAYNYLKNNFQQMSPNAQQVAQNNFQHYWGGIGFTAGPPYAGAVICFLAILGMVVLDERHKWWMLGAFALTIVMSWGGNFDGFNSFLLDHLPMYNKFRAPSMIIIVPTFLLCMLAILALQKVLFGIENKEELFKQLKKGLMLTGGVFAVLLVMYFAFDYTSDSEREITKQIASIQDEQTKTSIRSFFSALHTDRQHLFLMSIIRSMAFIAFAAGVIFIYYKKMVKPAIAILLIGLFSFIDVMAIDVKYLNADNYQEKEENEAAFNPSPADQQIMQDTGYYRVLNVVGGNITRAFNEGALTAYFHKSIGGYHPAKLSIYQDLVEKQLYKFPNCQPVVDMLNTKYYIYGEANNPQIQVNPGAMGPVWFVNNIKFENTPKEEMAALDSLNVRTTAVANQSFSNVLKANTTADSTASIKMVSNLNDMITYTSNAATEQTAVFSEVYYDKGWKAFVDSKEVPIAKVNYVLRAIMVPAGQHTIEFKFEPQSHKTGWMLTNIFSTIMMISLGAAIFVSTKRKDKAVKE